MGLKRGAIGNTLGEPREHIWNLMRTHWELEGNMLGTKKTTSDSALNISGFRVSPGFSAVAA
jgi:hypothetical protein